LSDVNKGHRSKPRQDQSNHLDVTSVDKEGCAKAHWLHSIAESIHIEACRMKFTLFHHTEGLYKSRMGALQQKAFDDLKKYLKQLPILSSGPSSRGGGPEVDGPRWTHEQVRGRSSPETSPGDATWNQSSPRLHQNEEGGFSGPHRGLQWPGR
jgi:hypothetical protein